MIRRTLVDHLVNLWTDALPGVDVYGHWPGDAPIRETIWPGQITGDMEIELSVAGPAIYEDRFEVPFFVAVAGSGSSAADVGQRCQQIVTDAVRVLRADSHLFEIETVLIARARVTSGPDVFDTQEGGWSAAAEIVIDVHARIDEGAP